MLVRDGDTHDRIDFNGYCDAIARSSLVQVTTGAKAGVPCPTGSAVRSRAGRCSAKAVSAIPPAVCERAARSTSTQAGRRARGRSAGRCDYRGAGTEPALYG